MSRAALALVLSGALARPLAAASSPSAAGDALAGRVSSAEEGPMEGVIVSATYESLPITVSVVTDENGRYVFPRARLRPGAYTLSARATGYELSRAVTATVGEEAPGRADLTLAKARDVSLDLTSSEWILSIPAMEKHDFVLQRCTQCHSLTRIAKSPFDARQFEEVIWRMEGHDMPSSDSKVVQNPEGNRWGGPPADPDRIRDLAEYLSSINLSGDAWEFNYPLRTLSRPRGNGGKVVLTEYQIQLPNARPHDLAVGPDGYIWYSDYAEPQLGRLDPRTGAVSVRPLPVIRPDFAAGSRSLELGPDGNFWIARYRQAGVTRYNPSTGEATSWTVPASHTTANTRTKAATANGLARDGRIWFEAASTACAIVRLDPRTGAAEVFDLFGPGSKSTRKVRKWEIDGHLTYDQAADSKNNLYFTDQIDSSIGRIDAVSGQVDWYPTPTPNAGPRRATMDSQDRLWFGEFLANRIGMFDTRSGKFREWLMPTPFTDPYFVRMDRDGRAWAVSKTTDRVVRLDVTTGRFTEYLMPRHMIANSLFIDERTSPATIWLGNLSEGSIVKLEPLD